MPIELILLPSNGNQVIIEKGAGSEQPLVCGSAYTLKMVAGIGPFQIGHGRKNALE